MPYAPCTLPLSHNVCLFLILFLFRCSTCTASRGASPCPRPCPWPCALTAHGHPQRRPRLPAQASTHPHPVRGAHAGCSRPTGDRRPRAALHPSPLLPARLRGRPICTRGRRRHVAVSRSRSAHPPLLPLGLGSPRWCRTRAEPRPHLSLIHIS